MLLLLPALTIPQVPALPLSHFHPLAQAQPNIKLLPPLDLVMKPIASKKNEVCPPEPCAEKDTISSKTNITRTKPSVPVHPIPIKRGA